MKQRPKMSYLKEAKRVFKAEVAGLEYTQANLSESFNQAVELILNTKGKIVVAGIGKSGIVAHKIAATLASTGTSAVYLNAGEALHGDLGVIDRNDVVLMLSNSASTMELVAMLPSIKQIGAKIIGLLGRLDTTLAKACNVILDVSIESEACPLGLAPMTSSTVALVMGDALASALMRVRQFKPDDFAMYHPGGSLGRRLLLRVHDVMHAVDEGGPVVTPETTLKDALNVMSVSNLGGVIITDSKRIIGVFTDGDLRRQILQGCQLEVPISEVMTKDPVSVRETGRLGEVLELMEATSRKVYFVPVVDESGQLCGALRMHDIIGEV